RVRRVLALRECAVLDYDMPQHPRGGLDMRVMTGVMLLSACVLAVVTVKVSAQGGGGQQAPKNLQVLPKDSTPQQVRAVMQTFTTGLGLMCNDCHAQDRSSDEKKEKQTARQMLKMAMAINNDFLKDIGDPPAAGAMKVTCYTCHRGQRKPLTAPP